MGGVVVDIAAVDAPVRRGATIAQLRVPVTPADRERWERNLELARAAGESATVSALEARLNVPDRTIGVLATADGKFVRALAVAGATVAAGSVIAEIELEDAMRIEVDVTALAASRVVAGSRARVRWTGGVDDVSVATVFAADGARVAVILLPQAKPEHFSERPVVEFP